jgi:hypothetical protein
MRGATRAAPPRPSQFSTIQPMPLLTSRASLRLGHLPEGTALCRNRKWKWNSCQARHTNRNFYRAGNGHTERAIQEDMKQPIHVEALGSFAFLSPRILRVNETTKTAPKYQLFGCRLLPGTRPPITGTQRGCPGTNTMCTGNS